VLQPLSIFIMSATGRTTRRDDAADIGFDQFGKAGDAGAGGCGM
jgi:hypothetical protein